ncbi:MAG: bile acid:sodium symporter family protein [Planctomycetaceae bacterium]
MREFLQRRWFLLALVTLIVAGHWLGMRWPETVTGTSQRWIGSQTKSWLIAGILYCMSVTLDGRRFRHALLRPLPVLWAIVVNAVGIPMAASLLLPWQLIPDFSMGLLIAASVPCTLAAASVWTRRAGGNDAVSLLVTLLTNGACILYTPFWLQLFSGGSALLDLRSMIERLFFTALLPTLVGQLTRLVPPCARMADRLKISLGVAAQIGVLLIVFVSACDGGVRLSAGSTGRPDATSVPSLASLLVVAVSCIALHLSAMIVSLLGAKLLHFDHGDLVAVAFAGSQKTLPIGVLIATDPQMFGVDYPWAVFPMLIFHASQLFIDTAVADRMRAASLRTIDDIHRHTENPPSQTRS